MPLEIGGVATAQRSCRDWIKQTTVVDLCIVLFLLFLILLHQFNWVRSSGSCYITLGEPPALKRFKH